MSPEVEQVGVLVALGLALLLVNIKAGSTWLKQVSLWPMLGVFALALWIVVKWVLL